jgi:hypothetical protein
MAQDNKQIAETRDKIVEAFMGYKVKLSDAYAAKIDTIIFAAIGKAKQEWQADELQRFEAWLKQAAQPQRGQQRHPFGGDPHEWDEFLKNPSAGNAIVLAAAHQCCNARDAGKNATELAAIIRAAVEKATAELDVEFLHVCRALKSSGYRLREESEHHFEQAAIRERHAAQPQRSELEKAMQHPGVRDVEEVYGTRQPAGEAQPQQEPQESIKDLASRIYQGVSVAKQAGTWWPE